MATNSTDEPVSGKQVVFSLILWSPLLLLVGFVLYLVFDTALLQQVYLDALRNMYYDCLHTTGDGYVYKAKLGACVFTNLEYDTVLTHDAEGFRNTDTKAVTDIVLIGDSHTQGFGVNDEENFSAVLRNRYHYTVKNLGMASYATMRELEALQQYSNGEKVVVIQYCENDVGENVQSLLYPRQNFLERVKTRWEHAAALYVQQKALGWGMPAGELARRVLKGNYVTKKAFEEKHLAKRKIAMEADAFAKVLSRYRPLLSNKKVVVFESSSYGLNHPGFKPAFEAALRKRVPNLDFTVMETTARLKRSDYYWLDDHPTPKGHAHIAAMLDAVIAPMLRGEVQSATDR